MTATPLHEATATTPGVSFTTSITIGPHTMLSDAAEDIGGNGSAPSPVDLLTAALASCTTMTVVSYAQRKGFPLDSVSAYAKHMPAEGDNPERFEVSLVVEGDLDDAQLDRMQAIAAKCPVHRLLAGATPVGVSLA